MLKVKDIMLEKVVMIRSNMSLNEVNEIFINQRINSAPIVDEDNNRLGLITSHYLLQMINNSTSLTKKISSCLAGSINLPEMITINHHQSVDDIINNVFDREFVAVVNDQDEIIGILSTTDLMKCWPQVKRMIDEFNVILNSTYNSIVVINTEGKITLYNKAAERMLGIPREEALGEKIDKIIPQTGLLEVLESGEPQYSKKLKLGADTAVSNRNPIQKENKIIGAVGVFQDISEIESISKELDSVKKLNKQLKTIIESSYDGIYITDGEGCTIEMNSAYERITGLKKEELIGEHMENLQQEGIFSQSVSLLVKKREKPVTIMQQINDEKDVIVTGNPVFNDNGELIRIVTNVRNITELNRLREELKEVKELTAKYHQELEELRLQLMDDGEIVAKSKEMRTVLDSAIQVSKFDSTVLVLGESGVGKELVAELIHKSSSRSENSFIRLNCGAIPEDLLESELFGYKEGAFTGAKEEGKKGMFELADGGTLFLDEIAELSLNLQVKLLRVIQEREIMPIGGTKPVPIDVRIIAATNRDLEKMVQKDEFRKDLFYRLNVVPISIPPLRARREEIPILISDFLNKFKKEHGVDKAISSIALEYLINYDWPGNVRELKNLIERLVVMSNNEMITKDDLPKKFICENDLEKYIKISDIIPLKKAVELLEKKLLVKALDKCSTTREAAKELDVHQSTIIRKKQKYMLD
ncbi:sigma 54-interacting transcriptional regulator [Halanaerobaculum tunisiense]